MSYYPLGPGVILYGDPTLADGAGMKNLGDHENVTFNPGVSSAYITTANTGDSAAYDGIYARPPSPELQAELYDQEIEILKEIVLGGQLTTVAGPPEKKAFGFGGAVAKIEPKTLVFVPESEKALGASAPHAIWIPAAFVQNLADMFRHGRLADGANNNPYTATFRAARRTVDQTTGSPVAIPEAAQFAFVGDPSALGLTWSLPEL